MIEIFLPIQSLLKFDKICIDNNVFRLHYQTTVFMLLVFCVLVTSKQFFGEPILCAGESKYLKVVNSYCWVYGTYTLKSKLSSPYTYPGVGPRNKNDKEIVHIYYQWVCFVLLGQAFMFYIPRYLWKTWEDNRIKGLVNNLSGPLIPKDWAMSRHALAQYFRKSPAFTHNMYALRYALCELLNLLNVIGQIYLLDLFLGGSFRSYGSAVTMFSQKWDRTLTGEVVSPVDKYFPKITKCMFHTHGAGGSVQSLDYICILPLNIVNEKIFIVLWFWLIFLSFMSALSVLYRITIFALPQLRVMIIMSQVRVMQKKHIVRLVRDFNFGSWFVLHLMGKNLNPILLKELVLVLVKEDNTFCV